MKLNKKKVIALALAVCLIATLSMGSLAWFTDSDSVTNDFLIAGSDDENPDDVFSVDVWEDATPDDPDGEDKIQDGIEYPNILPGDDLYKEVNVENTGAYAQYIRATVTVTDAHIWQAIYGEEYVALDKIATDLNGDFEVYSIVCDEVNDTLTYVLYYKNILAVDEVVTLFTNVAIPEEMTREQAAEMAGGFNINVVAEAVQTENVGNNAAEAFATVDMAVPAGNYCITGEEPPVVPTEEPTEEPTEAPTEPEEEPTEPEEEPTEPEEVPTEPEETEPEATEPEATEPAEPDPSTKVLGALPAPTVSLYNANGYVKNGTHENNAYGNTGLLVDGKCTGSEAGVYATMEGIPEANWKQYGGDHYLVFDFDMGENPITLNGLWFQIYCGHFYIEDFRVEVKTSPTADWENVGTFTDAYDNEKYTVITRANGSDMDMEGTYIFDKTVTAYKLRIIVDSFRGRHQGEVVDGKVKSEKMIIQLYEIAPMIVELPNP